MKYHKLGGISLVGEGVTLDLVPLAHTGRNPVPGLSDLQQTLSESLRRSASQLAAAAERTVPSELRMVPGTGTGRSLRVTVAVRTVAVSHQAYPRAGSGSGPPSVYT